MSAIPTKSALEFHPLADVFPLLDGEEFEALATDIAPAVATANGAVRRSPQPCLLFLGLCSPALWMGICVAMRRTPGK